MAYIWRFGQESNETEPALTTYLLPFFATTRAHAKTESHGTNNGNMGHVADNTLMVAYNMFEKPTSSTVFSTQHEEYENTFAKQ